MLLMHYVSVFFLLAVWGGKTINKWFDLGKHYDLFS